MWNITGWEPISQMGFNKIIRFTEQLKGDVQTYKMTADLLQNYSLNNFQFLYCIPHLVYYNLILHVYPF